MIEVAVTGAGGHMGREVIEAATHRDGMAVTLAVNRTAVDPVAGHEVADEADLPRLLDDRDPDVLVDFTLPDPSTRYVEACADAGVAAVVGTTGFSDDQLARIADAAESVPVLRASNFARGVMALRRAVREAVAALPDYDIELTETHHNRKRDAPSGTALSILDDVDEVRAERRTSGSRTESGEEAADRVHGREGEQPREDGEVGVHARRAGDVTGEHELLLAGNHEVLTLTHRAESRGVFAAGALDAADWLVGRPAGEYDFEDTI
ncbi:4-hydroxy-tetrahydrodipicolinate reductase [Haloplanus rubicundus]|uniref:4-hydroxy-tetrahydrodipicolinate reductase n=1 Tax=Haloplanus rubicundus TaxID=1547898 RepID=A0A345E4H4_9EURY|nr:4-hydroxy-tetrahydrodipicolinate reductase [Haloplanus rubicundus]AXG07096.1 4-hydroxy-tetrahydrodipicolinate reductase [Haloplanus rubicundus]AXG10466.1 4-hydroxy-tetrahydrodipicolinate reductase [Haloplanus rubicundus]